MSDWSTIASIRSPEREIAVKSKIVQLLAFSAFSCGLLLGQVTVNGSQKCENLRHTAVTLKPQEAMHLATRKDMPLANEKYSEARVAFAVWVDVEGESACFEYMGSKPDYLSGGDPDLVTKVLEALQAWRFKPYTTRGRAKPFTTVLSFHFKGKTVTID